MSCDLVILRLMLYALVIVLRLYKFQHDQKQNEKLLNVFKFFSPDIANQWVCFCGLMKSQKLLCQLPL